MYVRPEDMERVMSALHMEHTLAIDTETTGLEETDLPFGVSIATQYEAFFFRETRTPNMWQEIDKLQPTHWILQNAKFDIKMLERKGVFILSSGIPIDNNSTGRLVRNDHMKYNLDSQAKRELGTNKDASVEAVIKEQGLYEIRKDFFGEEYKCPRYDRVDENQMAAYAILDARLTYDIHKSYMTKLDEGSAAVFAQESALIGVCHRMERRGLLVNKEYTIKAMYHETGLCQAAKDRFQELTSSDFVNSAKSIQKHLSIELPKTEDGNPSLTDDIIESLITTSSDRDREIVETVRLIRTYEKRVSTYYKSYLNHMDKDNVIHPTMWIAGTRTGRFSYSDPNFQNMPKEEKSVDEFVVRGCIMPRPGYIFVSLDFKQMEYKMAIAYANQTDVIVKVMAGADFHQATADLVGITRSEAKTLNFAVLYGAGVEKIAGMLRCTVAEATRLKFKYFMGLPKVESLIDKIISTGRGRGYVTNWLGRRLYAHKEFCYALPNHLIQSGGADVVKKAMIQIDQEFPDLMMVLQVHDQLIFELKDDQLVHIKRIQQIMEEAFPPMNGVRLDVDIKFSKTSLAERDMKDIGELYVVE